MTKLSAIGSQRSAFGLRPSEWLSVAFFAYTAALIPFVHERPMLRWQPVLLLATVAGVYAALAAMERQQTHATWVSMVRDWLPLGTTLLAFREMDLFRTADFPHYWEGVWQAQDNYLLRQMGLDRAIEILGPVIPSYLETCYLLVYGAAAICVGLLYGAGKRREVDRFYLIYLAGTLGAYAFFPFFPSEAPRLIYPDQLMPHFSDAMRHLNLFLLRKATIHVAVFPSAHVSSAFSAAWAMLLLLPRRRVIGWMVLLYAISVAVATVYGRYHYAADAVAGFVVSVAAVACYELGKALKQLLWS